MTWKTYTPQAEHYRRGWIIGLRMPWEQWATDQERRDRWTDFTRSNSGMDVDFSAKGNMTRVMFRSSDDAMLFKLMV